MFFSSSSSSYFALEQSYYSPFDRMYASVCLYGYFLCVCAVRACYIHLFTRLLYTAVVDLCFTFASSGSRSADIEGVKCVE